MHCELRSGLSWRRCRQTRQVPHQEREASGGGGEPNARALRASRWAAQDTLEKPTSSFRAEELIMRPPSTKPGHEKTPRFRGVSVSPLTDSNRRPPPYHGGALPTELRGQVRGW